MARRLLALTALALLATAPAAGAGVSVGHSGWEWANPRPQGNTLTALASAGDTVYAAGGFGTLLRSADGGQSWQGLAPALTEDLRVVRLIGGDPASLVVAGGCALRRSDDAGQSFTRLRWTDGESPCRVPIASVAFPNATVSYVVLGDGRVRRSGDGGRSWSEMSPIPLPAGIDTNVTDVAFAQQDAGVVSTSAGMYRTSDGGVSWQPVLTAALPLRSLWLAPNTVAGYAVGDGGTVLKSLDGGATWAPTPAHPPAGSLGLRSIACLDSLRCAVTTDLGDRVLSTANGGLSWSAAAFVPGSAAAVAVLSAIRTIAAGADGALSLSADGGATWGPLTAGLPGGFSHLCARAGSLGLAVGPHGTIARSADGGETWTYLTAPVDKDIVDAYFRSRTTGFAIDADGSLFRTTDGGQTWKRSPPVPLLFPQAVLALDRRHVLLIGSRGIARSADGGVTFRRIRRRGVKRAVLFDADYAGGRVFAYGPRSLFVSGDGGRHWRERKLPDYRPLTVLDFTGARTGYVLGRGGRVWRSRNGGRSWRELLGVGTDGAMDLAFSSKRSGYVVVTDLFYAKGSDRPDYLLRTSDGGRHWRPQLVSNSHVVNGLLATRDHVDLLLTGSSDLFRTSSGGDRGRRTRLGISGRVRRLARGAVVTVAGRLRPARGGDQIVLSKTSLDPHYRTGGTDWRFRALRLSGGRFRAKWRIRHSSVFVAQWTGDGTRTGAGSRAFVVRLRH
jgi:photosystem II stability/assembly factor-like uncharacterized protein